MNSLTAHLALHDVVNVVVVEDKRVAAIEAVRVARVRVNGAGVVEEIGLVDLDLPGCVLVEQSPIREEVEVILNSAV